MIARVIVASLVMTAAVAAPTPTAGAQDARRPATPRPQAAAPARPDATREQVLQRADAALAGGRRAEAARLYAEAADRFQSVVPLLKGASLQSADGDARGAMASLGRARELAPNSEEVLSAYAQLALATRALLPAVATLEALARMCPTVAQYHYWLGVGLMQAGDMVPALQALQRADQLVPDTPLTLAALGLAMNVRKMYGEARAVLMRSLGHDPDSVETIAALAEAEAGLGNVDAAESTHSARWRRRRPTRPRTWRWASRTCSADASPRPSPRSRPRSGRRRPTPRSTTSSASPMLAWATRQMRRSSSTCTSRSSTTWKDT